jgi:hypothetical protein
VNRRRGCRIDEDGSGVGGRGFEVGHRQEGIRGRLEPDELHALGRRPRLVELDVSQTPALEDAEHRRRPEVAALGDRDRVAGAEESKHDARRGAGAG